MQEKEKLEKFVAKSFINYDYESALFEEII
jgi:hypothetical protein